MIERWRSMLFVPGDRPDLAAKAARAEPDLVVLDLEDAVPARGKDEARQHVRQATRSISARVPVCVRVNPPGSPWFDDDVAGLPEQLAGVVLPKLESESELARIVEQIEGRELIAGLETVRGVLDARRLLEGPVVGCYFGAEDYVADLGGVRTEANSEVATARALVAMAARVAGVPALDIVTLDFHDGRRFLAEAGQARALGYSGKLCIHPGQVPLAHQAFRPSAEELGWARRLLAAFEEAGRTTIAFEGQMVDQVVATRARAVISAASED